MDNAKAIYQGLRKCNFVHNFQIRKNNQIIPLDYECISLREHQ